MVSHRCTKTIHDDLSPQYQEHFFIELPADFNSYSSHHDYSLVFEVYDQDEAMEDERLGLVDMDIRQIESLRAVSVDGMEWVEQYSKNYELEGEPGSHARECTCDSLLPYRRHCM